MKHNITNHILNYMKGNEVEPYNIKDHSDQELSLIVNNEPILYNLLVMNPQQLILLVLKCYQFTQKQWDCLSEDIESEHSLEE